MRIMKKSIDYDGRHYTYDAKRGYYCDHGKYLHRAVWEHYHGKIPEGMVIHHIDHNRANNDISNLALLTEKDHRNIHSRELTDEQREARRRNMNERARPAAIAWHKSEAAKEFHRKQAHYMWVKVKKICKQCGMEFEGAYCSKFCSNKCKSAWRRAAGLDNIIRTCPICGRDYKCNKYDKRETCSKSCANVLKWRKRKNSTLAPLA